MNIIFCQVLQQDILFQRKTLHLSFSMLPTSRASTVYESSCFLSKAFLNVLDACSPKFIFPAWRWKTYYWKYVMDTVSYKNQRSMMTSRGPKTTIMLVTARKNRHSSGGLAQMPLIWYTHLRWILWRDFWITRTIGNLRPKAWDRRPLAAPRPGRGDLPLTYWPGQLK